jgi:hypothetical protein
MAFNPWLNTFISVRSAVMFYNRFISVIQQHNTANFVVSSVATAMQQHIDSAGRIVVRDSLSYRHIQLAG